MRTLGFADLGCVETDLDGTNRKYHLPQEETPRPDPSDLRWDSFYAVLPVVELVQRA